MRNSQLLNLDFARGEIPVQLRLPKVVAEASSRQQLASIALLGQEFWSLPVGKIKDSQIPMEFNRVESGVRSLSHSARNLTEFSERYVRV